MDNFGVSGAFVAVRVIDLWYASLNTLNDKYRSFVGNAFTIIVWSFGKDVKVDGAILLES